MVTKTTTHWEVIVGNVGKVYSGTNGFEARHIYSEYKGQSKLGVGRAGNEEVTMFKDGEPYWEHVPKPPKQKRAARNRVVKPQPAPIDADKVRWVFQSTAEATGSDIIQCCIDCGEEPVIDREILYDYIDMYGGQHKDEVVKWIDDFPGDHKALAKALDAMGVPKNWA